MIERNLTDLITKKEEIELEHFDTLMENADVQLKKQLLESLIERIDLNPDKTLKSIEFKFEVPNQHAAENNDKNVILTCDTVQRSSRNGKALGIILSSSEN